MAEPSTVFEGRGPHKLTLTARRFKRLPWPTVTATYRKDHDDCDAVERYADYLRDLGATRVTVHHVDHRPPWGAGNGSGMSTLLDALDLPAELQPVQDAYWAARREWNALRDAYELVLADLLKRPGDE